MSRSQWFFNRGGQVSGPVSVSELRELAAAGQLQPTDRVRKEDMDRWVKARSVKGLFDAPETSAIGPPPASGGESMFDFFGAAAAGPAPETANEFHPAFDFFTGAPAAPGPTKSEMHIPEPPARKSMSPKKSKPDLPPPPPVADAGPSEAAAAEPVEAPIPMAIPVEPVASINSFHAAVPLAPPPVEVVPPALPAITLTGPEVAVQPDGSGHVTGGLVELSLVGAWLKEKLESAEGIAGESYLRLQQLAAIMLRDRPGAGLVLSLHAGPATVAVLCEGTAEAAREFLRRVLETGA